MPLANSSGSTMIAYHGSPLAAPVPASDQQGDLRRGVETKPEQDADRVHLAGPGDGPGQPPEDAVHEAAGLQVRFQLGLVELAAAHGTEHPYDPGRW